jgi:S-formylglutathione hydrolase FrmB
VRRRGRILIGLAALAVAPTSAAAAAAPTFHDGDGLRVAAQSQLDSRLLALTVTTAALPKPANVRILLPAGYDPASSRRYPVFYLLHGTSGGAADWTQMGDAEATTAGRPMIVVMPDIALGDDGGGWCTNWWNAGAHGPPEWERFHIDELIPWIDANLKTKASRAGRAIAGLSQGGFCATSYAARHPDLFATALSYSGAPDIAYDPDAEVASTLIINGTEFGLDRVPPNSMFGDRGANELGWAGHDPATLAGNLRDTSLYLYSGNGRPGPLDPSQPSPSAMAIEMLVSRDTQEFHNRLDALGIPSVYRPYGAGTHSWPYWTRDLRASIGQVADEFAHPRPLPATIDYTSADGRYSVYGWAVTMHRTAAELSTLEAASARGFSLAGSGSATVLTPPSFTPGAHYAVTLRGTTVDQTLALTAGADRRLRIEVPLGPSNPYQQYTVGALLAGTAVHTTKVAISG